MKRKFPFGNIPSDSPYPKRRRLNNYNPMRFNPVSRGAMGRANMALRMIRKLKDEEEKKILDTAVAKVLVSGVAQYQSCVLCQQGTSKTTRIGNKICLQSVAWRMTASYGATETLGLKIRFMLVLDRRPEGQQATSTEVLEATTSYSLYNTAENNYGRFQILCDKVLCMHAANTGQFRFFKGFHNLRGQKVMYDANVGDITDVQRNNLFVLVFSEDNDQNASVFGQVRVRFTDA